MSTNEHSITFIYPYKEIKGFMSHTDLSMSKLVRDTMLAKLAVGDVIENLMVENISRGIKLTKIEVVKTSITLGQFR